MYAGFDWQVLVLGSQNIPGEGFRGCGRKSGTFFPFFDGDYGTVLPPGWWWMLPCFWIFCQCVSDAFGWNGHCAAIETSGSVCSTMNSSGLSKYVALDSCLLGPLFPLVCEPTLPCSASSPVWYGFSFWRVTQNCSPEWLICFPLTPSIMPPRCLIFTWYC